jgi:hypothetical protein
MPSAAVFTLRMFLIGACEPAICEALERVPHSGDSGKLPLMIAANAAKLACKLLIVLTGAPEEIRTPEPLIRSLVRAGPERRLLRRLVVSLKEAHLLPMAVAGESTNASSGGAALLFVRLYHQAVPSGRILK